MIAFPLNYSQNIKLIWTSWGSADNHELTRGRVITSKITRLKCVKNKTFNLEQQRLHTELPGVKQTLHFLLRFMSGVCLEADGSWFENQIGLSALYWIFVSKHHQHVGMGCFGNDVGGFPTRKHDQSFCSPNCQVAETTVNFVTSPRTVRRLSLWCFCTTPLVAVDTAQPLWSTRVSLDLTLWFCEWHERRSEVQHEWPKRPNWGVSV